MAGHLVGSDAIAAPNVTGFRHYPGIMAAAGQEIGHFGFRLQVATGAVMTGMPSLLPNNVVVRSGAE
jgi:hypothetical protein